MTAFHCDRCTELETHWKHTQSRLLQIQSELSAMGGKDTTIFNQTSIIQELKKSNEVLIAKIAKLEGKDGEQVIEIKPGLSRDALVIANNQKEWSAG